MNVWSTFVTLLMLSWIRTSSLEKRKNRIMKGDETNTAMSPEKRLTKHLLTTYKKLGTEGRPILNTSEAIIVMFGLNMMQMDLNEKENKLTTSVWCRQRWTDEYLMWNPEDFGGVKMIRLSSRKIWIPDIMLYNTADTEIMERDALITVDYNGSISWIQHRIYRSECKVDVTNFPFDRQKCNMTFGSWVYFGNEVDLKFHSDFDHMDLTDLSEDSTEWEVENTTESRNPMFYDCCPDPYYTLTFTLTLKRKIVFSTVILTLPCIFLAFMTLVVFWLPPDRPDRTGLAMGLFSSFLLLLLILLEAAPPAATSVPTLVHMSSVALGVYYCFNLVLIMLSVCLSSVVINVNRKWEEMAPIPRWAKVLSSSVLGRVLCLYDLKRGKSAKDYVRTSESEPAVPGGYTSVNKQGDGATVTFSDEAVLMANHYAHAPPEARNCNNISELHRRRCDSYASNSLGNRSDRSGQHHHHQPQHQPQHQQQTSLDGEWHPLHDIHGQGGGRIAGNDNPLSFLSDMVETSLRDCSASSVQDIQNLRRALHALEKTLQRINKNTSEIMRSCKYGHMRGKMQARKIEWQVAAAALDRLFFFLFGVAIFVSLIVFFPRPGLATLN